MTLRPIGPFAADIVKDLERKFQADAEKLAADYGYNVEALYFEYSRRFFGSFTTTLAGSPEQRDRFKRAWQIALQFQSRSGASVAAE